MQASRQVRRGLHPLAVLAALLAAVLLSGAAGYLVRGGLPQSQSQAPVAATDTVPSWAKQGTGPTDANAAQSTVAPPLDPACTAPDLTGLTC